MIGDAPKSPFTGLPGWETPDEEELLTRYAAQVPEAGVIVEIGGEWGRSAGAFARGAHDSVEIVTVDLFPGNLLDSHRANLLEAGFSARSYQIQANSHTFGHQWTLDKPIHLLFIDGDHTYEGAKADIDAWVKHVPVDGIVIFHDVAQVTNKQPHYLHFEVTRAITDWASTQTDFEAIEQVDTAAVFRRVQQNPPQASNEAYQDGFDYPVDNGLASYADEPVEKPKKPRKSKN